MTPTEIAVLKDLAEKGDVYGGGGVVIDRATILRLLSSHAALQDAVAALRGAVSDALAEMNSNSPKLAKQILRAALSRHAAGEGADTPPTGE